MAETRFHQLHRRILFLLGAGVLGLYLRTLAPGLLFGDPGEFQFAAWRFGLAHPTGYPLYLLLGGSWQHLTALLGADPTWSLNLFSALAGALAVCLLYLLLVECLPSGPLLVPAALFGALLFAFNPTAWSQNIVAEVYGMHSLLLAAVLLVMLRAGRRATTMDGAPSIWPWLVLGLAVSHHRTSLFLLPGVLLYLFQRHPGWWRRGRTLAAIAAGLLLPQLLYLYIPLRSGAEASPWLYPRLQGETIALYKQNLPGFLHFVTGREFAVSFLGLDGAVARLSQMSDFWLLHFQPTGLVLVALGMSWLVLRRRWDVLLLTVPFAFVHQIFNLFYGIGDIHVYYIALYLVASIWAGCGVMAVLGGWRTTPERSVNQRNRLVFQALVFSALAAFTLLPLLRFYPQIDRSNDNGAERLWSWILSAEPPADSILVSNDRNEIVPLYYYQAVMGAAPGMTGLFPLLAPGERFSSVVAVVRAALNDERPVYLIKPMPELSVVFDMRPANDPLVEVTGSVALPSDLEQDEHAYGPLTFLGYTTSAQDDQVEVTLYWRVNDPLEFRYTTSLQLYAASDGAERRIAQVDRPAGGEYYPSQLWAVGDLVREEHRFERAQWQDADRLQVVLYRRSPEDDVLIQLAPPLRLSLK